MERVFASSLIACMRDGRSADLEEVCQLAARIWREVSGTEWDRLATGDAERARYLRAAAIALGASQQPDMALAA